MLAKTLGVAKDRLQRFLTQRIVAERSFRDRFRDYWYRTQPEARGLRLLREWLSPEQLAQFEEKGYFDVIGCHSGRRYRIRNGSSMNIHEIDHTGQVLGGWCFVPNNYLVTGDVMLAQKIALETDERGALAVAKSFSPKGDDRCMLAPS
jgi:hypothetical protein